MSVLLGLLWPLQLWNDHVLRVGRWLAALCITGMVAAILVQVFCRYVLNDALPWPDEFARFLMLWMTGLIAPSAYRIGGFVAIDMLETALPRALAALLSLALLLVSLAVLVTAVQIGFSETFGFGGTFKTSTIWVPLDWVGGESFKLERKWAYMSIFLGFVFLTIVNIELILRSVVSLLGGHDRLKPLTDLELAGAE